MKILITGANGLVGKACQEKAFALKYDTSIVSSKPPIYKDTSWYKSYSDIPSSALNNKYDLLIHAAAATPNNSPKESIYDLNISIDSDLLDFINLGNVKHIVYLSTMAIYGKINTKVINENTPSNEPDSYGHSKLMGEELLLNSISDINSKLSIIRLPGVVGSTMPKVFFRRVYESILKGDQLTIRSAEAPFNNAVLDSDIFMTAINLLNNQVNKSLILNQHSKDIITLGKFFELFSKILGKPALYSETMECNPPFLITNQFNDNLLKTSRIATMIETFHESIK